MVTVLYVILGIVLLFVGLRFAMVMAIRRKKGQPAPELDGKYGKKIRQGKKVLFYFYGPTCPPCIQMTPIVEKIQESNPNVFKIDISKEMAVARKFGVMGTPCLVLVEDGKMKEFLMGPQGEASISNLML